MNLFCTSAPFLNPSPLLVLVPSGRRRSSCCLLFRAFGFGVPILPFAVLFGCAFVLWSFVSSRSTCPFSGSDMPFPVAPFLMRHRSTPSHLKFSTPINLSCSRLSLMLLFSHGREPLDLSTSHVRPVAPQAAKPGARLMVMWANLLRNKSGTVATGKPRKTETNLTFPQKASTQDSAPWGQSCALTGGAQALTLKSKKDRTP